MDPRTQGLGPRCSCDESGDGTPGDYSCGCRRGEEADGYRSPSAPARDVCAPVAFSAVVFLFMAVLYGQAGCLTAQTGRPGQPGNCSAGACEPCPKTPGSDCSRCDNRAGAVAFAPPADSAAMPQLPAVLDVVRVPAGLPRGRCARRRRSSHSSAA